MNPQTNAQKPNEIVRDVEKSLRFKVTIENHLRNHVQKMKL